MLEMLGRSLGKNCNKVSIAIERWYSLGSDILRVFIVLSNNLCPSVSYLKEFISSKWCISVVHCSVMSLMSIYLVKELSQGQPSNRLDECITWLDIFAPCVDYYLEVGDLSFIVFIKKDLDQKGSREMKDLHNFIIWFLH